MIFENTINFLQTSVNRQIENAKVMLNEKWYGTIQSIISKGTKKKLVPETTKPRLLKRFYNSVAALMTRHLQDMCIRSLLAYTDYICDVGVSLFHFSLIQILSILNILEIKSRFPTYNSPRKRRYFDFHSGIFQVQL